MTIMKQKFQTKYPTYLCTWLEKKRLFNQRPTIIPRQQISRKYILIFAPSYFFLGIFKSSNFSQLFPGILKENYQNNVLTKSYYRFDGLKYLNYQKLLHVPKPNDQNMARLCKIMVLSFFFPIELGTKPVNP